MDNACKNSREQCYYRSNQGGGWWQQQYTLFYEKLSLSQQIFTCKKVRNESISTRFFTLFPEVFSHGIWLSSLEHTAVRFIVSYLLYLIYMMLAPWHYIISLKRYQKNNIIKQEYQHIHCKGLFHKYGFNYNSIIQN